MTTRFAKTAAFATAALMTIVAAGCGNGADGAWDAERADAVWSQHVEHTGTPLTMQEFETTTWRAKNGDMVMFHDTSEAWPHMAMPTVRSADDHRSTLIPATVTDQSELMRFEFLQYADEKMIDHVNGSWFHQLDRDNHVTGSVWPGKFDLYHAFQSTLFPLLPPDLSIAPAVKAFSEKK